MTTTPLPHESRRHDDVAHHWDDTRKTLVRAAAFSPAALVVGWLTAWGAAIVAAASLVAAGVDLGLGLGIASGTGVEDGFAAGFWLAVIHAGAFVVGGYAAARIARRNGIRHAVLAWVLALIATGADAIASAARDEPQVIAALGLPYWNETGLGSGSDAVVALGIFALVGLAGALLGGMLGQAVNLAARKLAEHDLQPVVDSATTEPPVVAPAGPRPELGERRELDRDVRPAAPVVARGEKDTTAGARPAPAQGAFDRRGNGDGGDRATEEERDEGRRDPERGFDLGRSSDDHPETAQPGGEQRSGEPPSR